MDKLSAEVLKTIRKEELIRPGDCITAGLSGGADSVCLLTVLWGLKALLGCEVKAVHVNHCLRGKEAKRDEAFCRKFCKEREIPFKVRRVDVNALVRREGLSTEEAARNLRYKALTEEAGKKGLIAVAHHAGDQAETILLNVLRGAGLKGLSGMEYKRENIIRPLLGVERSAIIKYVEKNGIPYVTDSTNRDNDITRNRLRNVIMPELIKINTRAASHLVETARKAAEVQEYLKAQADAYLEKNALIFPQEGSVHIPRKKLKEEPQTLRSYVIMEAVRRCGIPLKDWGDTHFSDIDRLNGGPRGKHLDLPGKAEAETSGTELIIRKGNEHG